MSGAIGLRHEHLDVPADDTLRAVAEEAFGGRIEGFDGAVLVCADDPAHGIVHDQAQALFPVALRLRTGADFDQQPAVEPDDGDGDQGKHRQQPQAEANGRRLPLDALPKILFVDLMNTQPGPFQHRYGLEGGPVVDFHPLVRFRRAQPRPAGPFRNLQFRFILVDDGAQLCQSGGFFLGHANRLEVGGGGAQRLYVALDRGDQTVILAKNEVLEFVNETAVTERRPDLR